MPVTVKHAKSNGIADFTGTVTLYNSSGGSATGLASNLVLPSDWNSAHAITFSVDATELYSQNFFEPFHPQNTNSTLVVMTAGSWYVDPFYMPFGIGSGQLNFFKTEALGFLGGTTYSAASTGSISRSQTLNTHMALYRAGTGANTTRLESIWSTQISELFSWERRITATTTSALSISAYLTISFPAQYDVSGGMTYSSSTQSSTMSAGASTGASTLGDLSLLMTYISGPRMMAMPFATTLPPGAYYLAMMISSSSSSAGTNYSIGTMAQTQSVLENLEFNDRTYRSPGKSVSNTSTCNPPFHGIVATTSSGPFSTLGTSDMRADVLGPKRRVWNYAQTSY